MPIPNKEINWFCNLLISLKWCLFHNCTTQGMLFDTWFTYHSGILTLNILNCFKDYKTYIHILNRILDLAWLKCMKLTLEQQHMLSVLHSQCHASWCSGDFRAQAISRLGIYCHSRNIHSIIRSFWSTRPKTDVFFYTKFHLQCQFPTRPTTTRASSEEATYARGLVLLK